MNLYDDFIGIIRLLLGVYLFLLARGVLPRHPKNAARWTEWRGKYGLFTTITAIILAVWGLTETVITMTKRLKPSISLEKIQWQRVEVPKYGLTVTFPAPCTESLAPVGNGEVYRLFVKLPNGVEFNVVRATKPTVTEEAFFASLTNSGDYRLEKETLVNGHKALDLVGIKWGRFGFCRALYVKETVYMILVEGTGRADKTVEALAHRFIDSFTLE